MHRKRDYIGLLMTALFLLLFAGCASSSYETVPRTSAGTAQTLDMGTVVSVRTVLIDGHSTNLGIYGGAVVGSAVGSTIGSGEGSVLASAGGAVAGAIVGQKVEKALTTKEAQEITVELDDGSTIVVVQEIADPPFSAGDRVNLLESRGGYARVRHASSSVPF